MSDVQDPSTPRCIPVGSDGKSVLGETAQPFKIQLVGDSVTLAVIVAALAAANVPIDLNGQDLTGVGDLAAAGDATIGGALALTGDLAIDGAITGTGALAVDADPAATASFGTNSNATTIGKAGKVTTINGSAVVLGGPATLKSYTVAGLPAGAEGQVAYATDGRKTGEGGGGGTGCPVYFSSTHWRRFYDDAQVTA